MEQEIHITLRYSLATGQVGLNEIVYRLQELRDELMLRVLEEILKAYDALIVERLRHTEIYPSKARKGLGRHVRKGDCSGRYCRGRKVIKRGCRERERQIKTVFGGLSLRDEDGAVLSVWGALCSFAQCVRGGCLCPQGG